MDISLFLFFLERDGTNSDYRFWIFNVRTFHILFQRRTDLKETNDVV